MANFWPGFVNSRGSSAAAAEAEAEAEADIGQAMNRSRVVLRSAARAEKDEGGVSRKSLSKRFREAVGAGGG